MLRYTVHTMKDSDSDEISSLLSNKQRDWLRGDDSALSSPDRVVRSRIKARLRQGVTDWGVLFRSERIDSEEVMKAVRDESSSSSEAGEAVSSGGEMKEELQPDALDGVLAQLEMVSGENADDFDLSSIITQIRKVKDQHGHLDDEAVLTFAVAGAMAGLMGTRKTEKQARQWVEHHWPESDEVLEQWEEASAFVDA